MPKKKTLHPALSATLFDHYHPRPPLATSQAGNEQVFIKLLPISIHWFMFVEAMIFSHPHSCDSYATGRQCSVANTIKSGNKARRALPKKVRKQQLILATINSIARNGLSGTTMATITREAGLSMGIANLHFESKEKLLTATLQHITNEYNEGQSAILASCAYTSLTDKLQALLDFHFSAKLIQKNKLAVWFAFWGESKARPTYRRICSRSDKQAERDIGQLFQQIIDEGKYKRADAELLAMGYTALLDGLWLDLLVTPRATSRSKVKQVAGHYLASAFPNHIEVM